MSNLGLTFESNLRVFFLFLLMAYIGYAIGINLTELIFVNPDGKQLIPKFLNFADSLWSPYVQSGYYSLLETQYQSFYPLALLLKFNANTFTFNLFFLLNIALTGFCLFLYLREINLNMYASILGGMSFMLSGFVAGHKMHTALISASAWIPLVLRFVERSFKDESQKSLQLLYGAFAFSLVVLAGYPAMVIYCALVISGYAFFRIFFGSFFRERSALDKFRLLLESLLLVFIPGSFLGAVAVTPVWESWSLINRRELSFERFASPGWTLDALPMGLFPFFYGNIQDATVVYPWPYLGPVNLWEISWFIGILPFALFVYTFWIRRELLEARIWIALFLVGICLIGGNATPPLVRVYNFLARQIPLLGDEFFILAIILLLGLSAFALLPRLRTNPRHQFVLGVLGVLFTVSIGSPLLYRLLYHIPLLNLFVAPARHLFEVNLAMAILGAIGLNHLIENRSGPNLLIPRVRKLSVLIGVMGASFVAYYYLIALPRIRKLAPGFPSVDVHLIVPIIAIILTTLVLNLLPRFRNSTSFLVALLVFVFLDLFSFARFHYDDPTSISPQWDCLKIMSLEKNPSTFRVSIRDRVGMCGLLSIHGGNPIWVDHYMKMAGFKPPTSNLRDNPRLLENSNMLRLLSVKYLSMQREFFNQSALPPDFKPIEEHGEEALYVNRRPLPRIRFVNALKRVSGFDEAREMIYSTGFDPGNVALLTDGPDKLLEGGEIIESQFEDDSIRIRASTGKESFLVFADSWHPGWRVFIDKKPATVAKPYAFQMGVSISGRGEHLIEFRFEPKGYFVGKWVSLISLALMTCVVFYCYWQPRVAIRRK